MRNHEVKLFARNGVLVAGVYVRPPSQKHWDWYLLIKGPLYTNEQGTFYTHEDDDDEIVYNSKERLV